MKKLGLQMVACVVFLSSAAAVVGSAQTVGLRVNVPFGFNVEEKVLPPADYLILAPKAQTLRLFGPNGSAALAMTNQVSGKRPVAGAGAVVFNCYETRCFLARFWTARSDIGQEVIKSEIEKRLATQGQMVAVITLRAKPW